MSMVASDPCFGALTVGSTEELAPSVLEVSPAAIELTILRSAKAKRLLSLRNSGGGQLSWSIKRMPRWASVTPLRGKLAHGEEQEVTVSIETLGLPKGASEGELVIELDGRTGGLLRIRVAVDIVALPVASETKPPGESEPIPNWRLRLKYMPASERTVWHSAWIGVGFPADSSPRSPGFLLTYRQRRLLSLGREIEWSASFLELSDWASNPVGPGSEDIYISGFEFTLGSRKSWDSHRKPVGASVSAGALMWQVSGSHFYDDGVDINSDSVDALGLGVYVAASVRASILNLELRHRIGPDLFDTLYLGDWSNATELRVGLGWEW
jgi:hypothetical protein